MYRVAADLTKLRIGLGTRISVGDGPGRGAVGSDSGRTVRNDSNLEAVVFGVGALV